MKYLHTKNIFCFVRNEQKKVKKERHEKEKVYMQALRGVGSAVGEYVGDGQGESETMEQAVADDFDVLIPIEHNRDSNDNAHLLVLIISLRSLLKP